MVFTPHRRKSYPLKCFICGGNVNEQLTTIHLPDGKGALRLIEGVPAAVCGRCPEYYLTVETSQLIDGVLASPPSRQESIPVWEFSGGL